MEQGEKVLFTIPGNQRKNKPKNKGKSKVQSGDSLLLWRWPTVMLAVAGDSLLFWWWC